MTGGIPCGEQLLSDCAAIAGRVRDKKVGHGASSPTCVAMRALAVRRCKDKCSATFTAHSWAIGHLISIRSMILGDPCFDLRCLLLPP